MPTLALTAGAYATRSVIASAQRALNLYAEANPEGSPVPFTYYPTPGLRALAPLPTPAAGRGLYRATNGMVFAAAGDTIYLVSPSWGLTPIGQVAPGTTPVSMIDNGLSLLVVDGTSAGYSADITVGTPVLTTLDSPGFYGGVRADHLDTFFLTNKPGTPQFNVSGSLSTSFDALDFANKSAHPDRIVSAAVLHREIWLIGETTTEIWVDSGNVDFPFQAMSGAMIDYGCVAPYSVAKSDASLLWLSRDRQGQALVLEGSGYQAKRVSTHAMETAFARYPRIDDAVAYTYQQEGHSFYVLGFPSAGKTWCFDKASGGWHERASFDADGNEIRHRVMSCILAHGEHLAQDWETGALYAYDLDVGTDAGQPIKRLRSFPHVVNEGRRIIYKQFTADMDTGRRRSTDDLGMFSSVEPIVRQDGRPVRRETNALLMREHHASIEQGAPQVTLRWSDTRGASWGEPRQQSLGDTGEYGTSVVWWRLGQARDRVFEVSWSAPVQTALNGAWIQIEVCAT